MSVVFSGTNQGSFIATGSAKILVLRSDVDYLHVYNQSRTAGVAVPGTPDASTGLQFYWQRGMAAGTGFEWQENAASTAVNQIWMTSGGFTLIDNTVNIPGASVALTAVSNATPPLVSTANTAGLSVGDVVRLFNVTGAQQLGGLDFTIGTIVANTSFTLAFMRSIVAGTAGAFRRIPYDPYFYPPSRVISKINRANSLTGAYDAAGTYTIVTMTVTHAYTVGQRIRFVIPSVTALAFGMPTLNLVEATITAINKVDINNVTNTITVDIDSSAMGTFAWPLTANGSFTPAQIVPVGMDTAVANAFNVNPFSGAELNQGFIGIELAAGANSPAGQAGDVIYWVAGKSFNV